MFDDIEIEKCKFHHRKNLILLEDVDINKLLFLHAKKIINILLETCNGI